jgi:hypothetical protein
MKARIVGVLAAAAVAGTGLLAGAPSAMAQSDAVAALHCQSGYFCAYLNINYSGQILKSAAGSGSRVQVPGGTSSGSNATSNRWAGWDDISVLPDKLEFTWAPHSEANTGSAANDKINYFIVG